MNKNENISIIREDVNKKLKEEFDSLHEEIMSCTEKSNAHIRVELIKVQLSLAAQIIREERDLHGNGAYAFPPYTPSNISR